MFSENTRSSTETVDQTCGNFPRHCRDEFHPNGDASYALTLSTANYTFRRVNLTTALSSAMARLRERISLTNATVVDHDLPYVRGDADRLSEVFQHLIVNALTYRSDAAPRIEVRAVRDPRPLAHHRAGQRDRF